MPRTERTTNAAEKANDILTPCGQSGPRDGAGIIDRLRAVFDPDAVGEALDKLEERKHGG